MIANSTIRHLAIAALLAVPLGCASDAFSLDRYRDERAMDIENRLTRNEPVVKSPFGKTEDN